MWRKYPGVTFGYCLTSYPPVTNSYEPRTSTIRGIASEVRVGPHNGLDHESVVSCDNIMTISKKAIGESIGLLLNEQEPELSRAISDAFELYLR